MIKSKESLQRAGKHPSASTAGAGKPWSDIDDAALRKGLRQAMSPVEIAGAFGRTTEEVFQRLATLAEAYQHESAKDAERLCGEDPRGEVTNASGFDEEYAVKRVAL